MTRKRHKSKTWRAFIELDIDKNITLPEFREILDLLENCSKRNGKYDNFGVKIKLLDEAKKPCLGLNWVGGGTNDKIKTLQRAFDNKFLNWTEKD